EIMRKTIDNKEAIISAAGAYSTNIYIKASKQDSSFKKKEGPDSLDKENFDGLSLAEVSLRYDKSANGQVHEERLGVSRRGSTESLFYLSATEGDFNIYNNLIKAPGVSSIPFISPVS